MFETVGTPQLSRIEVLASGLDSPRKLSFGPDGALYVAEAGRGEQEPVFRLQVNRARFCSMAQRVQLPEFKTVLQNESSPDYHRWHYPMDQMQQVSMILSLMPMETPMRSWVLPAIQPIETAFYKCLILAS